MYRFHLALLIFPLMAILPMPLMASGVSDTAIRAGIAERFPGVGVENVKPSVISGLYEVTVGPVVIYASADGRYMVRGEIYDLETDRNLTQGRIAEARAQTLRELSDEEVIVFGKPDAGHTVTIFTDVTCTYCRLLHSKIEEYVSRGIRVRYAAFPRNGMTSNAWKTMEDVWCAKDRRKALTLAKLDREFESAECPSENVMEQWQLGRMLGVRGTPAIFTDSGEMIPGYLPPDDLLKRLDMGNSSN